MKHDSDSTWVSWIRIRRTVRMHASGGGGACMIYAFQNFMLTHLLPGDVAVRLSVCMYSSK